MLNETFKRRFSELEGKFQTTISKLLEDPNSDVEMSIWKEWATSAQSLIRAVFGEASPHYKNYLNAFAMCEELWGRRDGVKALKGIFSSAKEDFEGGYVFNVDLQVSGEVFGDFISMAKQSLAEGHKEVAAVLACASLEDTLKRYATVNGLDVSGKVMQEVINALKAKGLVSGPDKTLLDSMPKIRDSAMHADWKNISEVSVGSVIGYVEQFLLKRFSSP